MENSVKTVLRLCVIRWTFEGFFFLQLFLANNPRQILSNMCVGQPLYEVIF